MIHSESFDPHLQSVDACNRRTFAGRAIGRSAVRFVVYGALATAFVSASPAQATEGKSNASVPDPTASALFQAGIELLDAGNWKDGCSKFEASMALYPAASTLLNIARCYEHEGKLTLAWSAYQRALVINRETQGEERKKELDDVAKNGLAAIEPRLPRLKILAKESAPTGLRVTQNGKDVPVAVLGTVIPVDPGKQSIFAEAPGFEPFTQTVTVSEGQLVEIPLVFKKRAVTVVEKPTPGPGIPAWAWVSAGAGVVLLGGAAAFRVDQAFVEGRQEGFCQGDIKSSCPKRSVYDPTDDNARKNLDNRLFLGLGAVGIVGLGLGVAGFVMGQSTKSPAKKTTVVVPLIGPNGVSLGVGGRF